MAYCTNCGAQLGLGAKFCTACGAPAAQSGQRGSDRAAAADGGVFRGLWSRMDAAITGFSQNFSRVSDQVERLTTREKPGPFCLKNCLAEGAVCTACVQRQAALQSALAGLREQEQSAGTCEASQGQDPAASTGTSAGEAAQSESGPAEADKGFDVLRDEQRKVLAEGTALCNEMIGLLANAKAMTEASAKYITENGGSLAMSLSRMGDSPRGYKHYTAMTDEQLLKASKSFQLCYADYISGLHTGDTCTWATLEAEERIGKTAVIGAAIVGALAVSAAAAPQGGGLNQTLRENQERTRASNAEVARLRQHSMDIDQQARAKNRAADQALHQTFMQQRSATARTNATIRNREILRNDLQRASDRYTTESRFRSDVDRALDDFSREERKSNE